MWIQVLGPVRVRSDDEETVDIAERQLRLLLLSLVAADGEPVPAEALIDRLWEAERPADPAKVLRTKLSRLRTVLDRAHPGGRDRLVHTPAGYQLTLEAGEVDAERFRTVVDEARRATPAEQIDTLTRALEWWQGQPFGEAGDALWVQPLRARCEELRGEAVELLAEAHLETHEPQRALDHLGAAAEEPIRERLIGAMMLALYRVGRQHQALELFESSRQRLAEDLGVDPSPQLRELHGRILRHDPSLVPPTGAAMPAAALEEAEPPSEQRRARTNLPAQVEALLGRREEIARLEGLLDGSRLVTLTGAGGVGKTRLALHLAHRRAPWIPAGAWFIDLTELSPRSGGPEELPDRITSLAVAALDLPEPRRAACDVQWLCAQLSSHSLLLVLDNCEHVSDEAAVFVAALLRCAGDVQVLTTTREPLGLPEEQRFEVPALSAEAEADGSPGEAVEFFAARARAVEPSFVLDETTAPAVAELCRRLDGLPLALELAAGRMRGLTVHDLLERLSDRLDLLRLPGRGRPRRKQTLRGMIDWSWSLLDASEQTVLRRLAVHPGMVDLATAERICSDPRDGSGNANGVGADAVVRPEDVVDALISLVESSMVTTEPSATGLRYGLLESIAVYAAERLDDAGERQAVAQRHLDHVLDLSRQADCHLRGARQHEWLRRMEAERTQLRNAFGEAVATGDGRRAVALVVATFWYHWISGRQTHLLRDLRTAIDLPGPEDDEHATAAVLAVAISIDETVEDAPARLGDAIARFGDPVARAAVEWFGGATLMGAGFMGPGLEHLDRAVAVLDAAGRDWDVAVATSQREWFVLSTWGQEPSGMPDGRDPGEVLHELGDGYGLSQVLAVEHRCAERRGRYQEASAVAGRALRISLDLGLWSEATYWHVARAIAALRSGDVEAAERSLDQARALAAEVGYWQLGHFAALAEAMIARYGGDLPRARTALDTWISRATTHALEPTADFEDAFLAVAEGRLDRAEEILAASNAPDRSAVSPQWVPRTLELAAAIHTRRGRPRFAAQLLGTADAVRTGADAPRSALETRDVARVRELLGRELGRKSVDEAWAAGRSLDVGAQLAAVAAASQPA